MKKELSRKNKIKINIEREVGLIRIDLDALKIALTQKADVDFLKTLEIRLVRVEHRLKSSNL